MTQRGTKHSRDDEHVLTCKPLDAYRALAGIKRVRFKRVREPSIAFDVDNSAPNAIKLTWLPESVTHVTLDGYQAARVPAHVTSIESVSGHLRIQDLDQHIERIVVHGFNGVIINSAELPSALTHLTMMQYDSFLYGLPRGLTHLTLGEDFSHPLYGLPQTLVCLRLESTTRAVDLSPLITKPPQAFTTLELPRDTLCDTSGFTPETSAIQIHFY